MAVATKNSDENYKISEVYSKSRQDAHPLIITFQNGNLQRVGEVDFRGGIYVDNNSKKSQKNAIVAVENMIYAGQEKYDVCRNLILTRNRNTGVVRLIEVGNALLKALPREEQTSQDSSQDITDSRQQLGEAFGSKRQKRMLEQNKKMKIDIDTMKEQLEKTVSEKHIDALEMSQPEVQPGDMLLKYAPPMDRNASNVRDVYKIKDFLNDEQLESLKETADYILSDENHEIYLTEFIAHEISTLRASQILTSKTDACCLLLYADCIIRYLKESYKVVCSPKYKVCQYSESLNNLIFDNFSMSSDKGRTRPVSLKDKSYCYITVLLLIAGDCKISDAKKLSQAIGATLPKLSQMAKVVGAHVINDSKNTSIVLKLPLAQPPSIMMNKRRK